MDQLAQSYRVGLIEGVVFLVLFLLGFGVVTLLARQSWLKLGVTESLLARVAAALLLAGVAVGGQLSGPSGVVLTLVQGTVFSDSTLTATASRNQAILGIGLALAITVVGVIRIEMYHRRSTSPPVPEEDAEWKVEPPEAAGRR